MNTQYYQIAVGSKNPVKIAAARVGFQLMFPDRSFAAEGFSIASGVSDQPTGDLETRQGAKNRAAGLRAATSGRSFDYWVGIEGGVEDIEGALYASAWIVIIDCGRQKKAMGKSALFALPPAVKQLIDNGVELGVANDQVFQQRDSKQTGGAIGSLTGGVLGRQGLYEHAMLTALVPLKSADLF